ncbi:MAG: IS1595 family transposase [Christensenellales bacterium]
MTFLDLMKKFPTEESVIDYYIKIRYPNGVHCNHCGSVKVYQEHLRRKVFSCNDCRSTFSPFKGTIFEHSSTDLRKWMYAIHLFLNGKKGISGLQLQREIGVTYKTAWRMLQQIRKAMGNAENQQFVNTIVEIDETYVGGKPRKENDHSDDDNKPVNPKGRGTKKTPVVGVIDRLNKIIYARVAMPNKQGKRLTAKQLMDVLNAVSKQQNHNVVISDEYTSYLPLKKNNFIHLKIDHQQAFSDHEGKHTNNIESFWATLKRGVYGIYHHVSVEYLQRYVDEFCFRYNNRKRDMFRMVLKQSVL